MSRKFKIVEPANHTAPAIRLLPFSEIRLGKQRRYLVKGLIPRIGLTVVWGPPKSGKSFWTFDVAMHVALDRQYRGRRIHTGPVVYCAFEGQSGLEARVQAFRQRFLTDHEQPPFYLVPVTLDLIADHPTLIAAIKDALGDEQPVMINLDTLNRSLRGSESRDEDMTAYIRATDAIREAFDCTVVIVHHCGIDGTRPRGHTSLTGACDAQLSVIRDGADNVIVTVEEMKDGPNGAVIASRLEQVPVGVDEDGEPITSCVVIPTEVPQATAADPCERLTKNQRTMYSILHDAGGCLSKDAWYAKAKDAGLGTRRKADLHDFRTALEAKRLVFETSRGFRIRQD
jgi:hypothetical protein